MLDSFYTHFMTFFGLDVLSIVFLCIGAVFLFKNMFYSMLFSIKAGIIALPVFILGGSPVFMASAGIMFLYALLEMFYTKDNQNEQLEFILEAAE